MYKILQKFTAQLHKKWPKLFYFLLLIYIIYYIVSKKTVKIE